MFQWRVQDLTWGGVDFANGEGGLLVEELQSKSFLAYIGAVWATFLSKLGLKWVASKASEENWEK